jgi:hypothetical protein
MTKKSIFIQCHNPGIDVRKNRSTTPVVASALLRQRGSQSFLDCGGDQK